MSNNSINFQQLVDRKKLSSHGRDWLLCALDPFHDSNLHLEGFPDQVSTNSRVQCTTSSTTISSPDGNAYNARVFTTPFCSGTAVDMCQISASGTGYYTYDTANDCGNFGLVTCDAWNGASNPNASQVGATFVRQAMVGKAHTSEARLIALGIEIHNTTAPLYRSGNIVMSTQPNTYDHLDIAINDGTNVGEYGVDIHTLPPTSSANALLMPGSVQWEAEKGGYMVARIGRTDLPLALSHVKIACFSTGNSIGNATLATHTGTVLTNHIAASETLGEHGLSLPFAVLTGLSAETTLEVTMRAYIEYFPGYQDSDIVSFATPSPRLDIMALKLYGSIAPELPLGVPVSMNAKGDYFKLVLNALRKYLPAMIPAISYVSPAAGAAAAGINAALRLPLLKQPTYNQNRRKKSQKKGWGTLGGTQGS
jgi:hypothetical protein